MLLPSSTLPDIVFPLRSLFCLSKEQPRSTRLQSLLERRLLPTRIQREGSPGHPPSSITFLVLLKQIKRLDQFGWLSWVLLELQVLDFSFEGILHIPDQPSDSVGVSESAIQAQDIDLVHFLHEVASCF